MTALDTPAQAAPRTTDVPTPFTISVDNHAGASLMTVAGDLDMVSAPQLDDALACLSPNSLHTTLDCSGLTFCDSTGLAVLIRAHQGHQASGKHLTLTASPHVLQRLLTLTGLDHYLDTAAAAPTGSDAA